MPEAETETEGSEAPVAIRAAAPAPLATLVPSDDEQVGTPEVLDADGERPIIRRSEKPEES
jgi:hypothetical protein